MSWRTRWLIYEYVRNSLWIIPGLFVLLAIAMGIALPDIDESIGTAVGISFGADAGRGVLGALAGGMITFTGFVFSILLLAVQFGSGQFSPRMLRRFLRDPTTKISLGIFMATFIYSLLVLRTVGTSDQESFVPSNSISISLLLLLLSMIMFLRLISRTTQGLRVAAVLRDLGHDARKVIDHVYPDPAGAPDAEPRPSYSESARTVRYSGEAGILQSIDRQGLVKRAAEADAVIELVSQIGGLVAPGQTLFRIHGDGGRISDSWLNKSVAIGDERTLHQDPAFAFRLLADISSKALSPGVNDPTTSIQALDQIELLLIQLGSRRMGPGLGLDADGVVRLTYPVPTWEDYLRLAITETRQFGEGSIQVTRRLRALLRELADQVPEFRRAAVEAELDQLDLSADRAFPDHADRRLAGARDRQGLGAELAPSKPGATAAPRQS